ncbi:esterase/lipase family protein [Jiella marina]|uniref:esterase/lipase family protein n=1 Tax=Jiella sp. LLJ827 TaxID=2917712 RepID=UPI002100D1FD|nr:hypothetical protein [Jiella sp. LLJ827]MCQ0987013.1 hypothetical protein [Jiella sp. LLJ827]
MRQFSFSNPVCHLLLALGIALAGSIANTNAAAAKTSAAAADKRPVVMVPGLLGSKLCRKTDSGDEEIVWGTVGAITEFPALALGSAPGEVYPCGLIREISYLGVYSQAVYSGFVERLESDGYVEGKTLFLFDYDWRLSVFDNARKLAEFVDENVPEDRKIDIVAHSMGGLIARIYALEEGGTDRIAQLMSAGAPLRGSVEVFDQIENGWGLANVFMGGLETFRRTVLTFPSTFDLTPRYAGSYAHAAAAGSEFDPNDLKTWVALNWTGVNEESLPDPEAVRERQMRLRQILERPLPAGIEEAIIIGVDQRTPEQYALDFEAEEAELLIKTSWNGDGVVIRDSAMLDGRHVFRTSFATHQGILNESSAQDFVVAALAHGPQEALHRVPVRERTSILTSLGDFVSLVGVSLQPEQPIFRTGQQAKALLHIRPDTMAAVDAGRIHLTLARPGEAPIPLRLERDESASDPTNPYEQSFSASFDTGIRPGKLVLTATIEGRDGKPREAIATVPVIAKRQSR